MKKQMMTGAYIIYHTKTYNNKMARLTKKMAAIKEVLQQVQAEYDEMAQEWPELWKEYCEVNNLEVEHTGSNIIEKKVTPAIDTSKWDW